MKCIRTDLHSDLKTERTEKPSRISKLKTLISVSR